MLIQAAKFTPYGPEIVVALVSSNFTLAPAGHSVLSRAQIHFPISPIMLVSIEPNGFRAFATFQTARLLALLQLEILTFSTVDLAAAPECTPPPF